MDPKPATGMNDEMSVSPELPQDKRKPEVEKVLKIAEFKRKIFEAEAAIAKIPDEEEKAKSYADLYPSLVTAGETDRASEMIEKAREVANKLAGGDKDDRWSKLQIDVKIAEAQIAADDFDGALITLNGASKKFDIGRTIEKAIRGLAAKGRFKDARAAVSLIGYGSNVGGAEIVAIAQARAGEVNEAIKAAETEKSYQTKVHIYEEIILLSHAAGDFDTIDNLAQRIKDELSTAFYNDPLCHEYRDFAICLSKIGRIEEAREILNQRYSGFSDYPQALLKMEFVAGDSEGLKKSIEEIKNKFLSREWLSFGDEKAYLETAKIARETGDSDTADELERRLEELLDKNKRTKPESYATKALRFHRDGDLDASEEAFNEMMKFSGKHDYSRLTEVALELHMEGKLIPVFRQMSESLIEEAMANQDDEARDVDWDLDRNIEELGNRQAELGDVEGAKKTLSWKEGEMENANGIWASIYQTLVKSLVERGDIEGAFRTAEELYAAFGDEEEAKRFTWVHYDYITEALISRGDFGRAKKIVYEKMAEGPRSIILRDIATREAQIAANEIQGLADIKTDIGAISKELSRSGQLDRPLVEAIGIVGSNHDIETALAGIPEDERVEAKHLVDFQATKYKTEYGREKSEDILAAAQDRLEKCLKVASSDDKLLAKTLVQTLYYIDTKQAKDAVLSFAREAAEPADFNELNDNQPHLMRLLKTLAEMNSWRGNDLIYQICAEQSLNTHLAAYLIGKLIQNGFMDRSVSAWYDQRKTGRKESGQGGAEDAHKDIRAIQQVAQSGIMPSREIMEFIVNKEWKNDQGEEIESIIERLLMVKEMEAEFNEAIDARALVNLLAGDKDKAMAYYILNNGKTRFDLINNYSFDKFSEILGIIAKLEVNEVPMQEFAGSLRTTGLSEEEVEAITDNLRAGHHPFHSAENPVLERVIRLEVSDNSKLEAANREVSNVMGSDQIGVCLRAPHYRKYLMESTDPHDVEMLHKLSRESTLIDRKDLLDEIQSAHPEYQKRITGDMAQSWKLLGDKTMLNLSLENVLNVTQNPIEVEGIIQRVEEKRLTLRDAEKNLLIALKEENPRAKALSQEIRKKRKACAALEQGLEHNPDNSQLKENIAKVDEEIEKLKSELEEAGSASISERYASLTPEEKQNYIKQTSDRILALSEKDTSAIFTYLVMEVIGEDKLLESDMNLIKEIASHLSGPFQMIADLSKLDESGRKTKVEKKVALRMLDKKTDLMTMARFADSKICCFSSNNYNLEVEHGTPNKYWLASINADPLSFVFEIEEQEKGSEDEDRKDAAKKNLGFVFGMHGKSEAGKPAIFLNGVYLSTGNDLESTQSILNAIEEMLSLPLGAEYQFVASMYGGEVSGSLPEYSREPVVATRLRALSVAESDYGYDGNDEEAEEYAEEGQAMPESPNSKPSRKPETRVYDDLGINLNVPIEYAENVLHKKLR